MLWGQVGCGNEPGGWGGCIVKGVEATGLSANLLGQPGRGTGVGQVGRDDVAVGLRVVYASDIAGQPATTALVNDGAAFCKKMLGAA